MPHINPRIKRTVTTVALLAALMSIQSFSGAASIHAATIHAAKMPPNLGPHTEHRWSWPTEPSHRVIGRYDPPIHNWLPGHRGIDLAGKTGQSIYAAGSGRVTFAGTLANKDVVVITHGSLRTTYEPVSAVVEVDQQVSKGELIGYLVPGASHCASATSVHCLHWGLKRGHLYLNPLRLVQPRVRLLPLWQN
ncbi:MAG: peptidoglycan DD-metalloendopeptidase family protein [Actinobacteria bacterium]|uniref:Unannotated protein n=1 Tax=freshwater metagenome TaxID=449393 RepID=A0A6J5ZE60_9ZZZZ|nr:peptidoglycan DD-metalloendopeptidase family protein [Actinomycetota bacterium]